MIRIHLRFARPTQHLSRAVTADDGTVVAGVGTRLGASVVRSLRAVGVDRVWIREAEQVAAWEEDKALADALADLDGRFAADGGDPVLDTIHRCLRNRMLTRARRLGDVV